MRKVLLLCACLIVMTSCSNTLSEKFERVVKKVERKGDKMTDSDWKKSIDTFIDLLEEYVDERDNLKLSEKKDITLCTAKYATCVARFTTGVVYDRFMSAMADYSSEIDGLLEGLDNLSVGIADKLNRLIDDTSVFLEGINRDE